MHHSFVRFVWQEIKTEDLISLFSGYHNLHPLPSNVRNRLFCFPGNFFTQKCHSSAELIRNNPTCGKKYSRANFAFLICGILSAFTLSIISNFPVKKKDEIVHWFSLFNLFFFKHTNVFTVRLIATYLTFMFSVGAIYFETLLSSWMRPLLYSSRILPLIRLILTIISTISLLACKSLLDYASARDKLITCFSFCSLRLMV